jgi:phosphoadenosine phosphosulfate reductase
MNAQIFIKAAAGVPPTPEDRIRNAYERHGDGLIVSTSFGAQAAVMLHKAKLIVPDIKVVFVDTGYLLPETYRFADALTKQLDLNLHTYRPLRSAAQQEALEGKRWEGDEAAKHAYNLENKVEPMNRAVKELGATGWLSGLRRDQSARRAGLDYEEQQGAVTKYYPILDMTSRDVYYYLKDNGLPNHPLVELGYTSIGDWHSTKIGEQRAECGLHDSSVAPRSEEGLNWVI